MNVHWFSRRPARSTPPSWGWPWPTTRTWWGLSEGPSCGDALGPSLLKGHEKLVISGNFMALKMVIFTDFNGIFMGISWTFTVIFMGFHWDWDPAIRGISWDLPMIYSPAFCYSLLCNKGGPFFSSSFQITRGYDDQRRLGKARSTGFHDRHMLDDPRDAFGWHCSWNWLIYR